MNIYTASKFENYEQVRNFNIALRELGHTVTWDWTITEEFVDGKPNWTGHPTEEQRYRFGMLDYAGVMQAELVIMLDGDFPLNGARWEAGIAIGNGAQVWIVNYTHKVIFDVLPQVSIIDTIDDTLSLLEPNDSDT